MTTKSQALLNWIDERFPLTATWKAHLSEYYAPKNFNFWYFFGSLALMVLVIQILTGIFLVMHYKPDGSLNASGETRSSAARSASVRSGWSASIRAALPYARSRSRSVTFLPALVASATPALTASVVVPTPPLPCMNTMTCLAGGSTGAAGTSWTTVWTTAGWTRRSSDSTLAARIRIS